MIFVLWVVVLGGKGQVLIPKTGIYKTIVGYQCLVKENQILLLNQDENQIQAFDIKSGALIRQWGRQGQGPGEFRSAQKLVDIPEGIGVVDFQFLCRFKIDGTFIDKIPSPSSNLHRVNGGWIWSNSLLLIQPDRGEVWFGEEEFKNPRRIAAWGEGNAKAFDPSQVSIYGERNILVVSPDGKTVFIRPAGSSKVQVFNVNKAQIIDEWALQISPIPYDAQHWAEKRAKVKEFFKARGSVAPSRSMPKYYPLVSNIRVDPDGVVIISSTNPANPRKTRLLSFGADGQTTVSRFSRAAVSRTLSVQEGMAFVQIFAQEIEELQIAKVPIGNLNQFVKKNPLAERF